MTEQGAIYGRIVFVTAVHRWIELKVVRYAITEGYYDQMFPGGSLAGLDLPWPVGKAVSVCVNTLINANKGTVESPDAVIDMIVKEGVLAGQEAIRKLYKKPDTPIGSIFD